MKKSLNAAEKFKDLNGTQDFKYSLVPEDDATDEIVASITRPNSESALTNPQHQITGSFDEIHGLYLAIENFLRFERELQLHIDVNRTHPRSKKVVYPVLINPQPPVAQRLKTGQPSYFHTDAELDNGDVSDSEDDGGNGYRKHQDEKCAKIRDEVLSTNNGEYIYFKEIPLKYSFGITISHIPQTFFELSSTVRVQTKRRDIVKNELERSTDATYTPREFMFLRMTILDFLRCKLPLMVDFWVYRSTGLSPYRIESTIRRHHDLDRLFMEKKGV